MTIITCWLLVSPFQEPCTTRNSVMRWKPWKVPDGCEVDADKGYQGMAGQVSLVTTSQQVVTKRVITAQSSDYLADSRTSRGGHSM